MDLDKFLNLLATIFGALGAIYVMLSILAMSPELMLRQTQTYWDFSTPQIEALASQKADNVAGFVFVVIAFVLAIITIAFVPDDLRVFESKWLALALAAVLAGGLYATLHFVSRGISRHQKLAIGRIRRRTQATPSPLDSPDGTEFIAFYELTNAGKKLRHLLMSIDVAKQLS